VRQNFVLELEVALKVHFVEHAHYMLAANFYCCAWVRLSSLGLFSREEQFAKVLDLISAGLVAETLNHKPRVTQQHTQRVVNVYQHAFHLAHRQFLLVQLVYFYESLELFFWGEVFIKN
jgi:hypothetical protein